jgi:methionyl-tRNA synthetase
VDPLEAADRFGPDPLRLYLIREIIHGQDGDFSWERFETRYNADLANNLGNLVNRITAMASRYCEGALAPPAGPPGPLVSAAKVALATYEHSMERLALQDGAAAAYRLIDTTNEFINQTAPWALAKDPEQTDRLSQVLYEVAEAVRISAILLLPIMPSSCEEILRRLGNTKAGSDIRLVPDASWGNAGELHLRKGPALWPRIGSETVPA